jgi:hypothetical protein
VDVLPEVVSDVVLLVEQELDDEDVQGGCKATPTLVGH